MAVLGYFVKRGLVPRSGRRVALARPPWASPPRPVLARDGQVNAGRAQARGARAECRLTTTFVPISPSLPR